MLSQTRNTREMTEAAAAGYHFNPEADGRIRWEIPSLLEVVEGRIDGHGMSIHQARSSALPLSVTTDGFSELLYRVEQDAHPAGDGRMTIVDQVQVWLDGAQPYVRPDLASVSSRCVQRQLGVN